MVIALRSATGIESSSPSRLLPKVRRRLWTADEKRRKFSTGAGRCTVTEM